MADIHVGLEEITCHFAELEDPRSAINQRHPFVSVVVIAIMGVLAGANGPTGIAVWARRKESFLTAVLELKNGVPGKDVFRRVLSLLHPAAFQACYRNWLMSLRTKVAAELEITQPVLAVDGKTARRSHDRGRGLGALHSVTVWASEFGLSLGQVACGEKSNEITAIPELLKLVDIQGAIITIDAMGTQKAIAKQIIDQQADYVLALKGNQDTMYNAVADYIEQHGENGFEDIAVREHTTQEQAHGRLETRTYFHMAAPSDLKGLKQWPGLRSIGKAISVCIRDGKECVETRYFISSLAVGVKRFAHAVRSHWGIENGCHWILDMTYREDESRIRDQHLRENFAWLNRFTLSLLKQHPGRNSIVMKRRECGWDENFVLEILTGTKT